MSIKDLLNNKLPQEKLFLLPGGFEVIGDIAIINIPPALDNEKYLIAQELASHRKDIRTILRKVNMLRGEKRIGEFELLLGNTTKTLHRENGCVFQIDITKTYFSGKLAFERNRIVEKAKDGEDILVLFCGVGPFLIPIRKRRNVNVTGLDNNPDACALFKKNTELNNIDANIVLGDANLMANLFKKPFDRIVMPAPYGHDRFLMLACPILKSGGTIHFYTFKKDFEIPHFKRLLEGKNWKIDFYRACGGVAPRVSRYVFDLQRR